MPIVLVDQRVDPPLGFVRFALGYPMALALMALVALILYLVFRRTGSL